MIENAIAKIEYTEFTGMHTHSDIACQKFIKDYRLRL